MDDICRLCGTKAPLRRSHIVPKFVFDWVKTEGDGLRGGATINVSIQDGPKPKMFCGTCEGLFSGWEHDVSSHVFRPLHTTNATAFRYTSWMLKFAVSISFRVLTHYFEAVEEPLLGLCSQVRRIWSLFLLGERSILGPYEHHCVVLPIPQAPEDKLLSRFFGSIIDFQPPVVAPDGGVYIVTKMCRLCIVGTVKRGKSGGWVNTRIGAKRGVLKRPYEIPVWLTDYLGLRFRVLHQSVTSLSPAQRTRLYEKAAKCGWD